ncbi:MAG: copper-binding protein, partial [Thauera sp.]|nr:copper-binding protein [Thauera sp.]
NAPTRTTPVRLELANPEGLLRPGMFAHVDIAAAGAEPRLAVPESAVIDSGERQVVLLAQGEGRFKPVEVRLGVRGSDNIEVLEGLAENDEVVVSANFLIDAESNLQAALAGFSEAEASVPVYEATGSLEDIFDDGTVMMNHDPIPALQWPAMTMEFGLESKSVLEGVTPGEPLTFRFEDRGNGAFVVTEVEKRGGQ